MSISSLAEVASRSAREWAQRTTTTLRLSMHSWSAKGTAVRVLEWAGAHPLIVVGAPLAYAFDAQAPATSTLPQLSQVVHQAVYVGGTVGICLLTVCEALARAGAGSAGGELARRLLGRVIALSLALVSVRLAGNELDQLLRYLLGHPSEGLALAAGLLIAWLVLRMVPLRGVVVGEVGQPSMAAAATVRRESRSESEIYRTAVHEAGHLLLFGCADSIPNDLSVKIMSDISPIDPYRGCVTHSAQPPEVRSEHYLWWEMLMRLAGTEAESVVMGDRANGACEDTDKWIANATEYLHCGFGQVFYVAPFDEAQVSHNRQVLNDLKGQCRSDLQLILTANIGVLRELADAIAARKELDRDQLEPFLQRVSLEGLERGPERLGLKAPILGKSWCERECTPCHPTTTMKLHDTEDPGRS